MNNIYTDPSIEEGQKILSLWEKITSKPLTSREVEFFRLAFEAGRQAEREDRRNVFDFSQSASISGKDTK